MAMPRYLGRVTRMPAQWRLRLLQQLARWGVREETLLIFLAVLIGLGAGAAVWVFEKVLQGIEEGYFERLGGMFHVTTRWVLLLPLLPAAGGLGVVGVRWMFRVKPSRLHGVSAILFALIRKAATLRPVMGLETLLTSTLTIGTGGSAGPEAPIAVIGSSVGSNIGRAAGISRRNLPTLIGCGAAAGISAVFDAPIAGVLFSLEVMLRDFSIRTFTPIVISAVIATVTYQTIIGEAARAGGGLFAMPANAAAYRFTFHEIPHYLALGAACGGLAIGLTRVMGFIERRFERLARRVPRWLHPAIGAGLSGICGVALILAFRQTGFLDQNAPNRASESYVPIFAAGYPTIRQTLDPQWYAAMAQQHWPFVAVGFLAALCGLKLLATSLTLGGGGSGGVFAPALFLGATGGAAVGLLLQRLSGAIDPSSYALVGMGAVLAAAIQAPLMAIILLFELTRNYQIMLPAMLAAVTATALQQFFVGESLYTLPLRQEGIRIGSPVGVSALRRIGVDQMPLKKALVVGPNQPVSEAIKLSQQREEPTDLVVLDDRGRYLGMLTLEDLKLVMVEEESAPLLLVGEMVRSDVPPVTPLDTLEMAFERFARHDVAFLAVMAGGTKLWGVLARSELLKRYHSELSD